MEFFFQHFFALGFGEIGMDPRDKSIQELQESLSAINLQPCSETEGCKGERLLLEKILAIRSFRRYTLSEIISKAWEHRARVQIENVGLNTLKNSSL